MIKGVFAVPAYRPIEAGDCAGNFEVWKEDEDIPLGAAGLEKCFKSCLQRATIHEGAAGGYCSWFSYGSGLGCRYSFCHHEDCELDSWKGKCDTIYWFGGIVYEVLLYGLPADALKLKRAEQNIHGTPPISAWLPQGWGQHGFPKGAPEACWTGNFQDLYGYCCGAPPSQKGHITSCFADTHPSHSYHFCCNFVMGYSLESGKELVRNIPTRWTNHFVLHYEGRAQITISQNISYKGHRDGPAYLADMFKKTRKADLTGEDQCILWGPAEHAARAFIVGGLGHAWAQQQGLPLRVLDLGTGVGIVPIAAALAGHLALGIDINACMLKHAEQNVRSNGVEGRAYIGEFDICAGHDLFFQKFWGLWGGIGMFDLIVTTLCAGNVEKSTSCALDLAVAVGKPNFALLYVDWKGNREHRLAAVEVSARQRGLVRQAEIPMSLLGWSNPAHDVEDTILQIFKRSTSESPKKLLG